MTTLVVAIVAVCGFMVVQDCLGSGLTISQSRALHFWPGFFDGLGDYPNKYGPAVVAVTAVHFGIWSWQTFVVVTACSITSFFTSNLATAKESKILPTSALEQVSFREWWRKRRSSAPEVQASSVTVTIPRPGDLIFCHSTGIIGRGIRVVERFRRDWDGTERAGDHWNHVAILDRLLPTGQWTVIQADAHGLTAGATLTSLGEYEIVPLPAGATRARGLAWLRKEVEQGRRYGFVTVASILLTIFTPRFINVMLPFTWICSAIARAFVWACGIGYHGPDLYQQSPAQDYIELGGG